MHTIINLKVVNMFRSQVYNMRARQTAILLFYVLALSTLCTGQLTEGSVCQEREGRNGTCVSLYRCPSAAAYYVYTAGGHKRAVESLPVPELCSQQSHSTDGEPLVCCTDCSLDDTQKMKSKVAVEYGTLYGKAGPKAWTKCLEYLRDLPFPCHNQPSVIYSRRWDDKRQCHAILQQGYGIGGYVASRNQFPNMALLGYGADRVSAQWLCGGSVISERFILTAAHCASTPKAEPVSFAALGLLKRSELSDHWKIYKIKTIIKHPEYRSPHKYHDIALLETETEINFGKGLLPACLDVGKVFINFGEAPGWGRLGQRKALAEDLMVMELNPYNNSMCSDLYPPHRLLKKGYDNVTQMCYGRQDKVVDTCEGDSGGPLIRRVYACVFYVVGVTSFGNACDVPGNAGIYTRISHYVPWIESIVWPDT